MDCLDELKRVNIKKTQKDYRLLRKYEILAVTVEGITVKKLQKKETHLRLLCAEDVFDVIDAIHRASGHGGRTIVFRETSEKYANISRSQIELYLQFCEECHLKKSTVCKSVTVKPIVSKINSMNSRAQLVKEVLMMWPERKMVHVKPRHSQSQGSVERANRDLEAILACWMKDNNSTQWSQGLRFVQCKKNTRFHSGIGRTLYEALYGQKARLGVDATSVPEEVLNSVQTEE
ncbi:KRAB-A domain-containing protein 2-like [Macrobrachium nipponense]|uniref:KRAB-A domain-containing protein 2-like n=1 Tax=Macrobrachium nipponense TaxID=159736 RepID=UPI0030C80501